MHFWKQNAFILDHKSHIAQKMKFSIKDFMSKFFVVTLAEEILNGKLDFFVRLQSLN